MAYLENKRVTATIAATTTIKTTTSGTIKKITPTTATAITTIKTMTSVTIKKTTTTTVTIATII